MIHMVLELDTSVWSYVWLNMDIDRFMHVHWLNKHIPSSSDSFRGSRSNVPPQYQHAHPGLRYSFLTPFLNKRK